MTTSHYTIMPTIMPITNNKLQFALQAGMMGQAGQPPGGGDYDSGEMDYGDGGEYTIGGQRVMADFDDFGSPGQQWSPGLQQGADYGYDQDPGAYDEEEMQNGYQL